MDNYKRLKEIASYLKDDYKKINEFEALTIAESLVNSEVLAEVLLVNQQNSPVALEAIAMVLGYEKGGGNILDVLRDNKM